MSVRFTSYL